MTHDIDELEARGLVERQPDPADRRANVVVATPRGRDVHVRAAAATEAAERALHGELTPAERTTLTELLARIAYAG